MLSTRATDNAVIIAYVNSVGGQDELVFDGHSLVIDENGSTVCRGRQFREDLILVDLNLDAVFMKRLHDPGGDRRCLRWKGVRPLTGSLSQGKRE